MFLATRKFQSIRFFFLFFGRQNPLVQIVMQDIKKNLKLIFPSRSPVNVFPYHLSLSRTLLSRHTSLSRILNGVHGSPVKLNSKLLADSQ